MSAVKIDHKAEAEKIATGFGDTGGSAFVTRERYVAEAQVHATLALVEQRQLANRIAYVALLESQFREDAERPSEFNQGTKAASLARHTIVLQQIREGLGLA